MSVTTPRPELDWKGMPDHMRLLKVDVRGFPIPWFVDYVDGQPEFRAMDQRKWRQAIAEARCWVCGGILGRHRTFVIGPMCCVNRTTSEPPCHTDCATWSAKNCPFLSRPHMVRREDEFSIAGMANVAGDPITRNPGVALLWTTAKYQIFRAQRGPLIEIGDPTAVAWFCEGRPATRAEVVHSITTGLPLLEAACDKEATPQRREEARAELARRAAAVERYYPAE